MRLTNTIRDAYIQSAIDDVPQTDYTDQIRKAALEDAVAQMPENVRSIYNDPKTKDYVNMGYTYDAGANCYVPMRRGGELRLTKEAQAKIAKLSDARTKQDDLINKLREKLHAAAYGATTVKALREAIPEFAKYLPSEEAPSRMMPAVVNVVSEFVKAGWPKKAAA